MAALAFIGLVSAKESVMGFSNWSDLEDLVTKVSKAISEDSPARSKRDFPYNYDADSYNSIDSVDAGYSGYHTPAADERQGGAGTDIVFQFPQTTVPELIVNLAPFGSVGVLGYSIVRDIQLQGELDNIKRMIEDLENAGIANLGTAATSLCTTVTSLTSVQGCAADGCFDNAEPPNFGDKARAFLTGWSEVANPTCTL